MVARYGVWEAKYGVVNGNYGLGGGAVWSGDWELLMLGSEFRIEG